MNDENDNTEQVRRLSRRSFRRVEVDGLRGCVVCGEVAVAQLAGDGYCHHHFWDGHGYWRGYATIMWQFVHDGIDPNSGLKRWPTIPWTFRIGVMRFVAPHAPWPPDYALMRCDVCGDERVGPRRGWLCDACIERGRLNTDDA